jgi:hypothetical protein
MALIHADVHAARATDTWSQARTISESISVPTRGEGLTMLMPP